MLDAMLTAGEEDENGILFVYFPVIQLAAALSRCEMTVKRSLNELESVGLINYKNVFSKVVARCIMNQVINQN